MMSRTWLCLAGTLLLILFLTAALQAAPLNREGTQSEGFETPPSLDERPPCQAPFTLYNHDGTFENGYAWTEGGVVPPDCGAFAECFGDGQFLLICGVEFYFTQDGHQTNQTMDVYAWEDDGSGNPGNVMAMIPGVSPGPVANWPEFSLHYVDMNLLQVEEAPWWIGYWGNWPGAENAGWYIAADEDGFLGCPRTKIAEGLIYPSGWQHPNVRWGGAVSLGIQAVVDYGIVEESPICDIAADGADIIPILLGEYVEVAGVAGSASGTWDPSVQFFHVQDRHSLGCGTAVYGGPVEPMVEVGDSVRVFGTVAQFNGLTEISNPGLQVTIVGETPIPDPLDISTSELALEGEIYESRLIRIDNVSIVEGTWPAEGEDGSLTIDDGSGPTTLWIDRDTNIDGSGQPEGEFSIVGIGGQFDFEAPYDGWYEIWPRSLEDIIQETSSVDEQGASPALVYLSPSEPNPFSGSTSIRYVIPGWAEGPVALRIYDLVGRLVRTLVQAPRPAGSHAVTWDGTDQAGVPVAGGVYFYQLALNGETQTRRVILVR